MFNVTMLKKMNLIAIVFIFVVLLSACDKVRKPVMISPSPTKASVTFTESPKHPEPEDVPQKWILLYQKKE